MIAFNCHTSALASGGLSLLVPFFGGDDDVAALLLALAILERDVSAELVVLAFLEPNNPAAGAPGRGNGGHGNGAGFEVSQQLAVSSSKSLVNKVVFFFFPWDAWRRNANTCASKMFF